MRNIEIKIVEQPSIKFNNGEVFISTADIVYNDMKLYWHLPKLLIPEFQKSFNINFSAPFSNKTINEYCKWFEKTLGFHSKTVTIDPSITYLSEDETDLWSEFVVINSEALQLNFSGKMADIFFDSSQLSCAYIKDSKLLSIAFDNGTGSVTIITEESYRGNGYATECLSRLIYEYKKRGKRLSFGTTQKNYSAIKVAEKCKMSLKSKGYWIRVDPENSELYCSKINELVK